MESVREFLESKQGKAVAGGVLALAVLALFFSIRSYLGDSEAAALSGERTFICSQTGKPFDHTLTLGEMIPVTSPHSGATTGYPAELCYWTREGTTKKKPTAVLVRSALGEQGPTFCPDCGRLVVGHNPAPRDGDSPPPTQAEYKPPTSRKSRGERESR